MAALQQITAQQIVDIQGPGFEFVGAFSIADIDQHQLDTAPNNPTLQALQWLTGLLNTQRPQLNTQHLNDADGLQAHHAMAWWLWLHYWRLSRMQKNCPEACADPGKYQENRNRACKFLCEALQALRVTDPKFCGGAGSVTGQMLNAFKFNSRTTCGKKPYYNG